jgi:NADP-dependent 3-hydroxy acid dehydrogenase YdfG
MPMSGSLEGTTALVTGASSGIGEATALQLAAEGAAVALVARRVDRLNALADKIGGTGGKAVVIEADVTDQPAAAAAVDTAVRSLGRLDVVINNAGVMLLGPVVGAPLDEWQRMIDLNLSGLLFVTHVAGRVARSGSAVYNATKWGVNALSEALRQEVTGKHVRVGLVEPGAVATELASHNRPEVLASIRQRFGDIDRLESEDIARSISFMVTQPRHAAVNEILIRPTEQVG